MSLTFTTSIPRRNIHFQPKNPNKKVEFYFKLFHQTVLQKKYFFTIISFYIHCTKSLNECRKCHYAINPMTIKLFSNLTIQKEHRIFFICKAADKSTTYLDVTSSLLLGCYVRHPSKLFGLLSRFILRSGILHAKLYLKYQDYNMNIILACK